MRTWRDLDYAGPTFIHTIRDYTSSSANSSTFGVYHNDWTPKPEEAQSAAADETNL